MPAFKASTNWKLAADTPLPIDFVRVEGKSLVIPEGFGIVKDTLLPPAFGQPKPGITDPKPSEPVKPPVTTDPKPVEPIKPPVTVEPEPTEPEEPSEPPVTADPNPPYLPQKPLIITENTTWTTNPDLDPWQDVQVVHGVTLTIGQGVNLKGGSISVYGTLDVKGTAQDHVKFNDVELGFGKTSLKTVLG